MPVLHHTAVPTPTSGEISHTQKDLKVAILGAQNLTRAQLERDDKLKEASELIDTELLELPQRKELIREDGSLDIRTTYYEGGTMITIPNVRIETVKDYRTKFGLETNEGGLPGIEKSQQGPTPMATASTAIPSSTSGTEDPYGGAAPAVPSSSSAGEPRETVGETAGELVIAKRDCGTITQLDEYILNPIASINLPNSYTCTKCQQSQPAGFNYCRGCGSPIVSKTDP